MEHPVRIEPTNNGLQADVPNQLNFPVLFIKLCLVCLPGLMLLTAPGVHEWSPT